MYVCMDACMQLLLDHLKGLTKAFGFKVFALAASTSDLTCKSMSSVYGLRSTSECFCLFDILQLRTDNANVQCLGVILH